MESETTCPECEGDGKAAIREGRAVEGGKYVRTFNQVPRGQESHPSMRVWGCSHCNATGRIPKTEREDQDADLT